MGRRSGTYVISTILVMLLLLGACLVVATVTASADYDGDYTYSVNGDVATIIGYTGTGGEITIPATLGGYAVVGIGDRAFANLISLISVIVPNSLTSIGNYAFSSCTSMTSITIGSNVTTIGNNAFQYCTHLSSVIIPNNVTSIGNMAFQDCSLLTSVAIPNSVTFFGDGVFSSCTSLTSVVLPNNVTIFGNYTFSSCTSLTSVIIPNNVTSIGTGAFYYCTSLTSITIPDNITSIGDYAFYICSALNSVSIGRGVISIGHDAFCQCFSLASVTIPNNVTTIGYYAFLECTILTSIKFSGLVAPTSVGVDWILTTPASLRGHAYAESDFPTPGNVWNGLVMGDPIDYNYTVSDGNATIIGYNGAGGSITIPSILGGYPVVAIGDYAFSYYTSLTAVTIPDSVTSIGTGAFTGCPLISVVIGNGVTSIGHGAFGNCANLTSLIMGSGVTSIGDWAFSLCPSLTSIIIPTNVTSIGASAFYDCTSLESVTIPNGVSSIANYAFMSCTNLTSVFIGSNVTSIGFRAFSQCTALTSININASNLNFTSVDGVLYNKTITTLIQCPGGKVGELVIPDSVSLIGNCAFFDCISLTSVTLPSGLKSIDLIGFGSCISLIEMRFQGNAPACGANWIDGHNANLTIFYLANTTGFTTPTWYGINTVPYYYPSGWVDMTVSCDASTAAFGFGVQIFGNATYFLNESGIPALTLVLYYSVTSGQTWNEITSVMTDTNGNYSAWWTPTATGYYLVRAEWAGNPNLRNSSAQVSLSVIQYSNNYVFSVESNSTVTALSFNSTSMELSFTVSGPPGTIGYTRMMISKELVADPENVKLLFDGDQINYTVTERTDSWILMFTYHHSSHHVVAELTALATPSAPLSLKAIPGNQNITLSWSAPTYSNASAVTGYLISYGNAMDAMVNHIELIQLSYFLDGLTKGQTYYFEVTAKNDAGWGPNCTMIQSAALGVPDAPRGMTAIAGHELVDLNWTAPLYLGPGVLYYHLFRNGTLIWNGTGTSYEDVEVTNGVTYSYNVAANNSVGWGLNSTAVQATPISTDTAPSVPLGFEAIAGDGNATLIWTAPSYVGPGTLIYHLFRDNILIWNGSAVTYLDTPLIKNVSYSYNIAAQNEIGWGPNSSVSAIPYGVPDAPTGLIATAGDGMVSLNWTAPQYLGPGSVYYHLFRDQILIWNGTGLDYNDLAVANGITYTYTVSANNTIGWGENSTAIQAKPMSAEQTPTAPRNLTAIAGFENVTLAWDAPAYSNASAVSGYLISYGTSPNSLTNHITWNQLDYVLEGLTKGTTYYFNVAAQNSAGWGPNSTVRSVTPFGAPSVPIGFEAFAGDGNVTLNWTTPSYVGPGTIVYHLFRNGSEIWNGTGLTYHDNAVINGITYSYQLAASNSVSWGPNCTAVQATPQPIGSIPMAPIGLTAIAGNLQVDLNWTAPSYVGIGTITYHVFRDGTLVWSGIATNHRDTGLSNGQIYGYKVAASNAIGWGPNCTAEFATPSGVPDEPWGLTWEAGNSQVALSWKAVNYSGPGQLTYHLFRDGVEVWNGTALIHIDTGLINGHEYEYNIVASNSIGWGQLSITIKATPAAVAHDNTLLYIGIGVIVVVALAGVALIVLRRRK